MPPRVVAVTGAAGAIGKRLLAQLVMQKSVERIVAVDIRQLHISHPKIKFIQYDLSRGFAEMFADMFDRYEVEAVVHLAFSKSSNRKLAEATNVGGTTQLVRGCYAANIKRIVYVSNAMLYGARNSPPFLEDAAIAADSGIPSLRDQAQCESLLMEYQDEQPECAVSILRVCPVFGREANNVVTDLLSQRVLIGIAGSDPEMQFIHEHDMAEVLWRFIADSHPGVYNVAGKDTIRWSAVVDMAKRRPILLPAPVAGMAAGLAWKLRLQNSQPPASLDYVRYPWLVDTSKLSRELGFQPKYSAEEALESFIAKRAAVEHKPSH